ncbi:hypothetical protein SRHO_G00075830 [Serrasalmus rhombeus]
MLDVLCQNVEMTAFLSCCKWQMDRCTVFCGPFHKTPKELKYPPSGSGTDNRETTAATWPWFSLMDESLNNQPSISPPLLIASSDEAEPGPSSAVASPLSEERQRKRQGTNLLQEGMERETEREERKE